MKKFLMTAACAAALMGAPVAMADEAPGVSFSGTVGVTSDYVFRGISQTDENAAVQGGFTVSFGQWYGSIWASNVDFLNSTDAEVDFVFGVAGDFSETTSWDINFTYFAYINQPSGADYNYFEAAVQLKHDFGPVQGYVKASYSPEFFADTGTALWLGAGLTVPLVEWLSASGNAGYQMIENNALFGTPDYFHWDIGLTATFGMVSFDARYIDTDLSNLECYGGTTVCRGRFVGSAVFSF